MSMRSEMKCSELDFRMAGLVGQSLAYRQEVMAIEKWPRHFPILSGTSDGAMLLAETRSLG